MSSSGRDLYYLWEQQQWQAGKIDLSRDAPAPIQEPVETVLVLKDALTTALVPFVDSIPGEEAQVFLSTELVDEARHAVFFDRVLSEVLGIEGTMESRVKDARSRMEVSWVETIEELSEMSSRVRAGGADDLRAGIELAHVRIKGGQLRDLLRDLLSESGDRGGLPGLPGLPGLQEGLDLVIRDEDRHLAFANSFLGTESRIA